MIDQFGLPITGRDTTALAAYDRGVWNLMTLSHDPVADAQAAIGADPGLVMGHCLHAALHLLGTEASLKPEAMKGIAAARGLAASATARERGHIDALSRFADGSMGEAAEAWEAVLIDHPQDALALYAAHQCDFFLGRASELRDRPARPRKKSH
jgi:hypothetical protein